jgi:hypothetical protein
VDEERESEVYEAASRRQGNKDLSVSVGFLGRAQDEFELLVREAERQRARGITSSQEQQLLRSIHEKSELIKEGIRKRRIYGEKIKAEEMPRRFLDLNNLWKVRLVGFWRMLYTIDNRNMPEVVAFVLEICSHKKYDRVFGK